MRERYHYRREERQEQDREVYAVIDRSLEELGVELAQGKSEYLERYLAFTARFHRYSLLNQLLIWTKSSGAAVV